MAGKAATAGPANAKCVNRGKGGVVGGLGMALRKADFLTMRRRDHRASHRSVSNPDLRQGRVTGGGS
jgi:hypothetical protein